jgi:hypothetical protein
MMSENLIEYDIFLSYANEDKETIIQPIMHEFWKHGVFSIWFDEISIQPSSSVSKSIGKGILNSRYILVAITPNYLKKYWTDEELHTAISLKKTIVPIWGDVSQEEVSRFSPLIADKAALSFSDGLDYVVERIVEILNNDNNTKYFQSANDRIERKAFWYLVELYIQHQLGLTNARDVESINITIGKANIQKNWMDHVEQSLSINGKIIRSFRADFKMLDGNQAVIALVGLLKERSMRQGVWCPPTEGEDQIIEIINKYKDNNITKNNN